MRTNWNTGQLLKLMATVIALFALAAALVACGGDDDIASAAELSALDATVEAQRAEIQLLNAQISRLQTEIAVASSSNEVASLQAAVNNMRMEMDAAEPAEDYSDDIGALEDFIVELDDAVSENADAIDSIPDSLIALASAILDEHADEHDGLEAELQDAFEEHGADHDYLEDAIEEAIGELIGELIEEDEIEDAEIAALMEQLEWLEQAIAPAITQEYVDDAIRYYNRNGVQATLAYYNTMDSVIDDMYLFVLDANYNIIVHPTVPSNIGQDIRGPIGTDINGKNFGAEIAMTDAQGKWVDYVYFNPTNNALERKHTWVVRHDNLIFGSGWYERGMVSAHIPADYVQQLVAEAIERYDSDGKDATVAYYNSPESVDGEYYVFIGDENDVLIAHAIPEVVGLPAVDVVSPDGYPAGAQVVAAVTEDGAWTSYTYLNPSTGNVETKHSWVIRHDGMIFGSGWYEEGASKADEAAYTQAFVERAINLYNDLGLEGTLEYYNSPESIDGQWYVFIGDDENDVMIAHAAVPQLVGMHADDIVSPDGYPAGAQVVAAATEDGAWTIYTYLNAATGNVETKHSWVVRYDGLLFGSGWYEPGPSKSDAAAYTQAFVERAINLYNDLGYEGALAYYNTPESVDDEWYMFIIEDTEIIGHYDAEVRGQDVTGDIGTDVTGYEFGYDVLAATEDGKWVSYVFNNPASGELESKHAWIVENDGLLFGSGWYADPEAYTKYVVDEAIAMYEAEGNEATLNHYNDPDNIDGQWYVYIIDADSKVSLANAARPEFVGAPPTHRIDPTGYDYGEALYSATEEGKWISYIIKNPATEEQSRKHAWIVRHDNLFFGAGWYEDVE